VKFVCDRCGKRYTSADSPAPGHVYSIPCKACGNRITVKGAEVAEPGGGPWPDEPSRRRRAAPEGAIGEPTPRPAAPHPTPPPAAAPKGPPPIITRAPAPAEPEPTIRDDPFAAAALAQRRAAALPHIDPFADMPELSSDVGAGPLTDVPEIRGPIPKTPSTPTPTPTAFNARAAAHGLLIDEAKAKELARVEVTPSRSLADVLEPPQEAAQERGEDMISFSDQLPIGKLETAPTSRPTPAAARAQKARPRTSRSRVLPIALAAAAVVAVAGGGGYYYMVVVEGSKPGGPTATQTTTATPTPPATTTPTPPATTTPTPPATTSPTPPATTSPTPPATPIPVQPVAEAPAPTPPPPAPPRAEPAPPRPPPRAEQRRRPAREERRVEAPARAAPAAQAKVEVEREPLPSRAAPAPKKAEPARAEATRPAGGDQSLLDLLGKKQDAPTSAPSPRPEGLGLQKSEVKAVISRGRKSFDSCVEEWMRKEPGLDVSGIRVNLIITINPSGAVTAPVVDNPDIDRTSLGACLKSTARKMVFPSFSGDSFEASVPLVLGKGE
jgi:DNA-directed RNA polymerase subunit RPC12/RpoP